MKMDTHSPMHLHGRNKHIHIQTRDKEWSCSDYLFQEIVQFNTSVICNQTEMRLNTWSIDP